MDLWHGSKEERSASFPVMWSDAPESTIHVFEKVLNAPKVKDILPLKTVFPVPTVVGPV